MVISRHIFEEVRQVMAFRINFSGLMRLLFEKICYLNTAAKFEILLIAFPWQIFTEVKSTNSILKKGKDAQASYSLVRNYPELGIVTVIFYDNPFQRGINNCKSFDVYRKLKNPGDRKSFAPSQLLNF